MATGILVLDLSAFTRTRFVNPDGTLTREAQAAMNIVQRRTGDVAGVTYADTVAFTPAGGISATDVQAALQELDTEKQPKDATLTAIAALVTAADELIYATGSDAFAVATLTAFARSLLDDVDAATARGTLGLGTIATQAASNVAITGGAVDGTPIGATTASTAKFTTVQASSYSRTPGVTVASLPAAATAGDGARAFVTDATQTFTSANFGATVTGGGANKVPVVSNGTNWLIG